MHWRATAPGRADALRRLHPQFSEAPMSMLPFETPHVLPNARIAPETAESLVSRYLDVRSATELLAEPLTPEDQQIQSMALCSPTKWHRAHTSWFFDTFLLEPRGLGVASPGYKEMFNSYYQAVGPRHPRPKRGVLSRPSASEVAAYRRNVDARMVELFDGLDERDLPEVRPLVDLGLAHEQQHQELILTDILHAFSENPLRPAYRAKPPADTAVPESRDARRRDWVVFEGGLAEIGVLPGAGFAFDNEGPRHRVWLEPFALSTRLLTVAEMKAFIEADGYRTPSLWLSDGYDFVSAQGIDAPLYWQRDGRVFGLDGLRPLEDTEPVAHVSFYEADAVARFFGARLPTEAEWEVAARAVPVEGNFRESDALRPLPRTGPGSGPFGLFGDAWEWTQSGYAPYPSYRPAQGALGEYNGKFMVNQQVLRGGSCLTPMGHIRPSYRNFWHPETRLQMTGIRLAKQP